MRKQTSFFRPTAISALLPLFAISIGCQRPLPVEPADHEREPVERGPWTSARVIESDDDLMRGPFAGGKRGDLLIENDLAAFVLRGRAEEPTGDSGLIGALVDAMLRENGSRDQLELLAPICGALPPSPVGHETIEIEHEGGEGEAARVLARGKAACGPSITMETTYELAPGSRVLRMTTTLTNEGEEPFEARAGDEIHWGGARQWMPGHGFDPLGSRAEVPWIAGLAARIGYGWMAPGRDAEVENGPGWSRAVLEVATIEPGESLSFDRTFIIGAGNGASLLEGAQKVIDRPMGVLTGIFQEVRTAKPLSGGLIEVRDVRGHPFVTARAADDGTFRVPLPPGEWIIVSREPGRVSAMAGRARLEAGGRADATVEATAAGSVEILVVERHPDPEAPDVIHHFPVPARLTVHGVDGTTTPSFGPPYDFRGARNIVFLEDGRAKLPLAPGRYRARATRGIEYESDEGVIDIFPGQEASLELRLSRSVDTRGYVSADLHQHTNASRGSRVSRRGRVVSNATEGLGLVVVTDRGTITDLTRPFAHMEEAHTLSWLPGIELAGDAGHFGCFPLPLHQEDQELKTELPPESAASAGEIFSACRELGPDAIVQVNHPRDPEHGYFALSGLDAAAGSPEASAGVGDLDTSFDAVEVMSGSRPEDTEQAMRDWFHLLNKGHRITGTGGSGARCLIDGMNGYPRTYLRLDGDPTPENVAEALREGRALVTNGPFPHVLAQPATRDDDEGETPPEQSVGVGETLRVAAGAEVNFEVRVEAPSWVSIDRLSLVRDGEEALVLDLDSEGDEPIRYGVSYNMTFERDGWVLLRVSGRRPSTPPGLEPDEVAVPAEAFTGPIWIEVSAD